MSTYTKTYPLPSIVTKTFTITSPFVLPIRKVCTSDLLTNPCCGFNFNHCGNDFKYFQPVCVETDVPDPDCLSRACPETDILNFQFAFPDNFNNWGVSAGTHGWVDGTIPIGSRGNWLAAISIINANDDCTIEEFCDVEFIDYALAFYVGALKKNGKTIQAIQVDPTQIPCCKFYFKFEFNFGIGDVRTFYSEPFEKANCCLESVKILGEYPKTGLASTDCDGKYYGKVPYFLGTLFYFQNFIRIPAEFKEIKTVPAIKTREGWNGSNMSVVSSTNTTVYSLRSRKLPLYIIHRLKTIIDSKIIHIENKDFIFSGELANKITDLGSMWLIENEFNEISGCLNQFSSCDE